VYESAAAIWALFGPEQEALDGLESGIRPALRLLPALAGDAEDAPDSTSWGGIHAAAAPIEGQLSLTWNQMLLSDLDPEPRQPSLLPVPQLWEEAAATDPAHLVRAPGAPGRRTRTTRRPRQRRAPEDQLTLFG
jgi:hypothetical protein